MHEYAMRLVEWFIDRKGRKRQRTVIVTARQPFRCDDSMTADAIACGCGGHLWTKAEWLQDHWFMPRRWGTCELVPPVESRGDESRLTDCG